MVLLVGAAAGLLALLPPVTIRQSSVSPSVAEPLLMRAVSGYTHSLVADYLWLGASDMGEMSGKKEDDLLWSTARSIAVQDPHFFPAINYFATYFASIHNRTERSAELYRLARRGNPGDPRLYLNDIMLRLTYEKGTLDDERIASLVKEAYAKSDLERLNGIDEDALLAGALHYARDVNQRKGQARKDMEWLLEQTEDEARKRVIEKALGRLRF